MPTQRFSPKGMCALCEWVRQAPQVSDVFCQRWARWVKPDDRCDVFWRKRK